jgi:diguanylate cyclase (GGDEF)-like protein
MPFFLKPLLRLSLPLVLLALSFFALSKTERVDTSYLVLLEILPYGLFLVVLGLSHYFNRSRFFSAALLLAGSFWVIQSQLQVALIEMKPLFLYTCISLLLPLGLLLLTVLPERGLWNRHGVLALLITPLLFFSAYLLNNYASETTLQSLLAFFNIKPYIDYVISLYASGVFLVSLVIGLLILLRRDSETEAALSTCLVFTFITLALFNQYLTSIIMFSAAGLTLIISLLRSSFEMAYRDDLTGLLGRRAFNEKLHSLSSRYVIAMVDIDHFKKFNDKYGHDVGDDVLKVAANHINAVSGGGIAYRYGGEEFCIIFPRKNMKPTIPHLDAIREIIHDHSITLRDKKMRPKDHQEGVSQRGRKNKQTTVTVTISIGVAERNNRKIKPEAVLKEADNALYKAKQSGRNCLVHQ